jgi:hypothetical protein
VPADVHALLLVCVPSTGSRCYPQSNDSTKGINMDCAGRDCSVQTYLGTPASGPEAFDLTLVLANDAAFQSLDSTLRTWAQSNSYPGILPRDLPPGITEAQVITVRRAH